MAVEELDVVEQVLVEIAPADDGPGDRPKEMRAGGQREERQRSAARSRQTLEGETLHAGHG